MRRIHRKPKPVTEKRFRMNQYIRTPEIFLIDAEGVKQGVMGIEQALAQAQEAGLDLVEVNPKAEPPIVKIMDYGQFKYEQDKKAQKQKVKNKKVDTKGLRLSVRIGDHDFNFRLEQAKKFLAKGNKLQIELRLKGREKQHPIMAKEVMTRFYTALEQTEGLEIIAEEPLTKQGAKFTILLANKAKK